MKGLIWFASCSSILGADGVVRYSTHRFAGFRMLQQNRQRDFPRCVSTKANFVLCKGCVASEPLVCLGHCTNESFKGLLLFQRDRPGSLCKFADNDGQHSSTPSCAWEQRITVVKRRRNNSNYQPSCFQVRECQCDTI